MTTKHITITIPFLLIFNFVFCQSYNNATYTIALNKNIEENDETNYTSLIQNLEEKLKEITFKLNFNNSNSHFVLNKNSLTEDENKTILNIADMIGDEYWSTKVSDTVFVKNKRFKFIKNKICYSIIRTEWIITNETKTINGLECIKAYSTLEKEYGDGTKFKTYDLTAWFCPDIKYSFGPKFYKGLPGLIIELEQNLVVFKLLNLDYIKEKEKILIPKENSISESSVYDMLESTMPKQ